MARELRDWSWSWRWTYPWHQWMNGSPWRITAGIDYQISDENMLVSVRNRATRYGVKVRAEQGDGHVVFQFYVGDEGDDHLTRLTYYRAVGEELQELP